MKNLGVGIDVSLSFLLVEDPLVERFEGVVGVPDLVLPAALVFYNVEDVGGLEVGRKRVLFVFGRVWALFDDPFAFFAFFWRLLNLL